MENYYWRTEEPHANNQTTMCDWIDNHNTSLEITFVDGTYAEGVDESGIKWEIHAKGDGDFNNHCVAFVELAE